MYSDVLKKIIFVYLPRIVDDQLLILIQSRPSSMFHQYPNIGGGVGETYVSPGIYYPTFDIGVPIIYIK